MMSAINSLPSSETGAEKKAYEPSMEEILASIRRIIADDQSLPVRPPPREPEATIPARTQREVPQPLRPNEITATTAPISIVAPAPPAASTPASPTTREAGVAHGAIAAPQFAMPDGPVADEPVRSPSAFRTVPPAAPVQETPEPAPPPVQAEPAGFAEREADPSHDAPLRQQAPPRQAPEKTALFSAATDSAVSSAFNMLAASRLADNSDELMTLAREMIRPLLRSWIDENLPGMVERMVRAEIERVARGGR